MSRQAHNNAEQVRRQSEGTSTAAHPQYRQSVGPRWSDSEEGGDPIHLSNNERSRSMNQYGEPLSPAPPYSELASTIVGPDPVWLNERVNFHPGPGGCADLVTGSSGRCERFFINGFGIRVPWPFPDHENSSYNGEEDPEMIYLESGRILPRNEWDAEHPLESSSDESVDNGDPDTSQCHCDPRPRTGHARLRNWSSEDDDSESEHPRARSRHMVRPRYSGRSGRGGRFALGTEARPPHPDHHNGRFSDQDQEEASIDSTDSERSDDAQARYYRVWGSTAISLEMAASTGARRQ